MTTVTRLNGAYTQTAPSAEPVTRAQAKQHVRVDVDDDDSLIDDLIAQAREAIETATNRQLITSTVTLRLDRFPFVGENTFYSDRDASILAPRPPLQSVTSITYITTGSATATVATTVYGVDTASEPGRVYLKHDRVWPTALEVPNAVTVTLVAGYGSAASDVPERARGAVKLLVGHWYNNREEVAASMGGGVQKIPDGVERLVWSLKVPRVSS